MPAVFHFSRTEYISETGLCYKNYKDLAERYQGVHDRLYKEACTLDDMVYNSPKDAKIAMSEKAELDAIYASADLSSEKSLRHARNQISAYDAKIYAKDQYIDELEKRIFEKTTERELAELEKHFADARCASKEELVWIIRKIENTGYQAVLITDKNIFY